MNLGPGLLTYQTNIWVGMLTAAVSPNQRWKQRYIYNQANKHDVHVSFLSTKVCTFILI